MRILSRKKLYLPALSIVAVVFLLLVLVSIPLTATWIVKKHGLCIFSIARESRCCAPLRLALAPG